MIIMGFGIAGSFLSVAFAAIVGGRLINWEQIVNDFFHTIKN